MTVSSLVSIYGWAVVGVGESGGMRKNKGIVMKKENMFLPETV